jgi:ABC-type nitrate/sulfonate/bicarbonate transport system substrate-binding protein
MKHYVLLPVALINLMILAVPAWAQMRVRLNWTALAGTQSGLWVAHEEGIFKRNGLEVELLHIPSSSRAIQAMLAGEIGISYGDGRNAVQANLTGAHMALIAGASNRLVFSFMARPEIKTVGALRGKKIGITRIGSSTHTAALYVLNRAGLKPGDYQILPLMEVPNILAALMAGQVDAGPISPPTNVRARKAGFAELVNLGRDGPEYAAITLLSTRSYIRANEEITRRVVRSYAEAIHLFKTDKAIGLRVLQKYAHVKDPDILEATYNESSDYIESVPYVSRNGLETVLAEVREIDPKAKQSKADDFLDMRFVADLEREGLFKKLWGK